MKLPDWVLPFKEPRTEIKYINGSYYKYAVSYKYNPQKKRTDKITGVLLGKITPEGFVKSAKYTLKEQASLPPVVDIKMYGTFGLFRHLLGDEEIQGVLSLFPVHIAQALLCVSYYRFCYQSPLKRMPFYHERDFCSEHWCPKGLSDKMIRAALRHVGQNRQIIVEWMRKRIGKGGDVSSDYFMIDSTHIPTVSERLHLNAVGYNQQTGFEHQVRLMYIFSSQLRQPLYYRLINGNITDVKSMKRCIEELGIGQAVFIADKGFYSRENVSRMRQEGLPFIIPLHRNNALIDYKPMQRPAFRENIQNSFVFQKRVIWFYSYQRQGYRLVTFLDEELRARETQDYILRCETHPEKFHAEGFRQKSKQLGTLTLLCHLPSTEHPSVLYQIYKQRHDVELMFDAYKNFLEADTTYMQDRYVLEGWLTANFIAMITYYRLYQALLKSNKLDKISPKDVLELSKGICKMKIKDQWMLSEITKKTKKLLESIQIDYLK